MDLSSSDDESREPLAKVAKITATADQKDSMLAFALSDSDSRGSFDKASSVAVEDKLDVSIVEPVKETSLLHPG